MNTALYFNLFSLPVILAGVITLALGLMATGKGNKQGELYFAYLMFACFGYSVFYTLEICSLPLDWMQFFVTLEYVGAVMLGPLLLGASSLYRFVGFVEQYPISQDGV